MKCLKKVLLLIIALLFIGNKEVNALSKTFQYDGFTYTINNIHLDIYKSKLDNNNNYNGYDTNKISTINLGNTIPVNPTYYEEKSGDNNKNIYIMLNLDTNKEELLNLIGNKVGKPDKDKHYFIKMVCDITINQVPQGIVLARQNVYDNSKNSLEDNNTTIQSLIGGQSFSETFANFEYKLVNNKPIINYTNTYSRGMPIYMDYLYNYTYYSSGEDNKIYRELNFVNYKNIKDVLATNVQLHVEDDSKVIDNPAVVSNITSPLALGSYIVGIAAVIIGSFVLVRFLRKEVPFSGQV